MQAKKKGHNQRQYAVFLFVIFFEQFSRCEKNEQDIQAMDDHIFEMHDLRPAGKENPVEIKGT
jgi:hypothetical protein